MNEFSQIDFDISEAYQKKQMDKECALYYEAANYFEDKADIEAACFLYTQALVIALEENHELKEKIIYKLVGGLKSSMVYLGARNISNLKDKPNFVKITKAGFYESMVHNVDIVQSGNKF